MKLSIPGFLKISLPKLKMVFDMFLEAKIIM